MKIERRTVDSHATEKQSKNKKIEERLGEGERERRRKCVCVCGGGGEDNKDGFNFSSV